MSDTDANTCLERLSDGTKRMSLKCPGSKKMGYNRKRDAALFRV